MVERFSIPMLLLASPLGAMAQSCEPRWSAVGGGVNGQVYSLLGMSGQSATGRALYAGGWFSAAGAVPAYNIARWDGSIWEPLAGGTGLGGPANYVTALAAFDDGSGPELYAGGWFPWMDGILVNRIARWNAASWSPVGSGFDNYAVFALAVFDSGDGPQLHAGGLFTHSAGTPLYGIAHWNGGAWEALGNGMSYQVNALAVFDDGTGTALYAGGVFDNAAGVPGTRQIARWDGESWSSVGGGMGTAYGYVRALAVFDDGRGNGPQLYAGGRFSEAGGVPASYIARWNGAAWSPVGSGMNNAVFALQSMPFGNDRRLYAGGFFTTAGGAPANRVASWDGIAWAPLAVGTDDSVEALAVWDDNSGGGPALYAGGYFEAAGGFPARGIARWGCSAAGCYTNCDGSTMLPVLNVQDFTCFLNRLAAGDSYANCDSSTAPPILNIQDFSCFLNRFASGCT